MTMVKRKEVVGEMTAMLSIGQVLGDGVGDTAEELAGKIID